MGTRLFLVRHAETEWSTEQRVQGRSDPLLSGAGIAQAAALADTLASRPVRAVYTSPLRRAAETATIIAARHGLTPRLDPAFEELAFGTWEGRAVTDLMAEPSPGYAEWLASPARVSPPRGEALEEARDRVVPALAALARRHDGETVVLVTHSVVGRLVVAHCLGAGLDVVARLKLKAASISILRLGGDRGVLERLGDVSHLNPIRGKEMTSSWQTSALLAAPATSD